MTTIAEFTLPAAEFPLGRVFEDLPEATLELDRVVPTGDTVMPHFWVRAQGGDFETVLRVFEELDELRDVVLMEELGDQALFRAEWEPEYLGIMAAIAESRVTVLSATGSTENWLFELRAEDAQLSAFQGYCDELGVDVTLARLSRLSEMTDGCEYGLTPAQRDALVLAYADGYYDSPRGTDLETIADQFGITRQALSARLRRGYHNLIKYTLLEGRDA